MRPKCSRSGKTSACRGRNAPPGVDQVDARQAVLQRDFLRAQVLLHGERIVGAALHRGVVGDDDDVAARDAADAGHEARGGRLVVVHAIRRERGKLEERGTGIDRAPRCARAPAACLVRGGGLHIWRRRPPAPHQALTIFRDKVLHAVAVRRKFAGRRVDVRFDLVHGGRYQPQQSVLKRQAGQRHTACMRYISAPQRSHVHGVFAGFGGRPQGGHDRSDDDRDRGLLHPGILDAGAPEPRGAAAQASCSRLSRFDRRRAARAFRHGVLARRALVSTAVRVGAIGDHSREQIRDQSHRHYERHAE